MNSDREALAKALYKEFGTRRHEFTWDEASVEYRDHFRMKAGKITVATKKSTRADTLPQWLAWRWGYRSGMGGTSWDDLQPDDRLYWEHEAAAVRRAVARNGFKEHKP